MPESHEPEAGDTLRQLMVDNREAILRTIAILGAFATGRSLDSGQSLRDLVNGVAFQSQLTEMAKNLGVMVEVVADIPHAQLAVELKAAASAMGLLKLAEVS